jgi:hypothetical protein
VAGDAVEAADDHEQWLIARRLAMGEAGSVSRLVGWGKADPEAVGKVKELEGMLK